MDLQIRQKLQRSLKLALTANSLIALRCTGGRLLTVTSDFVCYETHVEATDHEGQPHKIPYSEIEAVDVAEPATKLPDADA